MAGQAAFSVGYWHSPSRGPSRPCRVVANAGRAGRYDPWWKVASLRLPPADAGADLQALAGVEAVRLFVERAVLPLMRGRQSGHIVQMSSVNGVVHGAGGVAYVGSRYALEGMSASLTAEVAHPGIGVTIVEPGAFRTDFGGRSLTWGQPLADHESIIAPARRAFEASHGSQPGDPRRAARAIIAALGLGPPPLRLPLGEDAFTSIRAYMRARLAELDATEALGADIAYPRAGD